jgi:drug/metabolite transporter (DMT)-like permease
MQMIIPGTDLGVVLALLAAFAWVFSGIAIERYTSGHSPMIINFLRIAIALGIMAVFLALRGGSPLALDVSPKAWKWLMLSGVVGFVFGDYFLFASYQEVGARIGLLMISLSTIFVGIISYFLFDEVLTPRSLLGITLTLLGVLLVVLMKGPEEKLVQWRFSPKGILYGLLAAFGQAIGLVLSKLGMGNGDPFAATQIRIIGALAAFIVIMLLGKRTAAVKAALSNPKVLGTVLITAFVGTFLGVTLSLAAVQNTQTAIASAVLSIMPVLIIPVNFLFFKEKIQAAEVLGTLVTVLGVVILSL